MRQRSLTFGHEAGGDQGAREWGGARGADILELHVREVP